MGGICPCMKKKDDAGAAPDDGGAAGSPSDLQCPKCGGNHSDGSPCPNDDPAPES
jgi:hypothetical protein